ncbi:MAG TPA: SUMF1/EgtB/PvdO family nonheme iron enzyme, partial [Pirellulales bacterium]
MNRCILSAVMLSALVLMGADAPKSTNAPSATPTTGAPATNSLEKMSSGIINSIGMEFVDIAPGTFQMGVDSVPLADELLKGVNGIQYDRPTHDGDYDEVPVHEVKIAAPFKIGVTEVTVEQFKQFKPDYAGNSYWAPYASGVSWNDAVEFCKWLSKKEGKPYRLPTEAEWEYACRAGTRTPFSAGNHPAAAEDANAWGVKNMQSGVAEWCLDWHGLYPAESQTDPVGPASGIAKVVRGGGLDYRPSPQYDGGKKLPAQLPYSYRSANRASAAADFASAEGNIGFRVVQGEMPKSKPLPARVPFFQTAVKQTTTGLKGGPDPAKPYFHTRPLFPNLGKENMREIGWKIGFEPGLGSAYHNSAVQVCDNGDLVAAYYNTLRYENDPDQTVLSMRLRYGSDEWDMPEPWPDLADAADAAPIFWNHDGTLWFFWGSPRLLGGPPFQYMTSRDNGATWSEIHTPVFPEKIGNFVPQPINSVIIDKDSVIYLPTDAKGGSTSVLWSTADVGKTWHDTGGRTGGRHSTFVLGKDGSFIAFGGKNSNINGFMPLSVSHDSGKSYEKTASQFLPLGGGQRPSVIRLASGRIFFVADYDLGRGHGKPAFVALSDDEGATWKRRDLPVGTVGYVTATQAPNGLIHIVTSKTMPAPLQITLNEAWVLADSTTSSDTSSAEVSETKKLHEVREFSENFAGGKPKARWSGGTADDGQFYLDGKQMFFYDSGAKQWESNYAAGKKI